MIDNPLPDQVMQERDLAHLSDLFNQTVFDQGLEMLNTTKYILIYMMNLQIGI